MLLDLLEETLPEWMFQPARAHWSNLMATVAVGLDCLVEGVYQARLAAMPGQVDDSVAPNMGGFLGVDALSLIGRDRRIRRGLGERPEGYALRLRKWLQSWSMAGTPWGLLQQLQGVLGPDAGVIRIVEAGGSWWTLNTDGTLTFQPYGAPGWTWDPVAGTFTDNTGATTVWNWDASTLPTNPGKADPGRFWVILYAPLNSPYEMGNDGTFNSPGVIDDYWNAVTTSGAGASPDAGVIGLSCPVRWVDLVRTVISDQKPAGIFCDHVIVSFDPTAFNPTSDSTPTSIPNGQWGWCSKYDAGSNTQIPARFPNAEYIPGGPGGAPPF